MDDTPGGRIRVDLPGPVVAALLARAEREDRTPAVEAYRIIRLALEHDGDLPARTSSRADEPEPELVR